MKKFVRGFTLALVASLTLAGCSQPVAPSPQASHPAPRELARTDGPTHDFARREVVKPGGSVAPGSVGEAGRPVAQAPQPDPEATPRKKARNGQFEEPKRVYDDLLKDPAKLGFKPSEYYFNNIGYHIRQSFVEAVTDEQLLAGIKKEVTNLLNQAKISPAELSQIPPDTKLQDVLPKLKELYGKKIDVDLLTYAAILGMLDGTKDHYSVLMTPNEYGKLQEQMQARTFGGIGIYIELDRDHKNQLTVFEPIEGTPAAEAGVEAGDKIIKIDGKSTEGITLDQAQASIRGPIGSKVLLTVDRRGEIKDISVTRGQIHVVSVTQKMFPNAVGYVRLRMFGSQTAEELDAALKSLKEQGAKGVILDLRNNGGGYIDAAVNVVGEFSAPGSLVVYTLNRNGQRREYKSTALGQLTVPMVVLINEYSASASEITAGALRDHKLATLVGDHSFGKGSVQQLYPFGDGSALKLTIAKFFTPGGSVIDKQGIEPQVIVEMEPRFVGKTEHDVQLKKALEILDGKIGSTRTSNS